MTGDVRMQLLRERDAAIDELRAAIDALDVVEPASLREPLRWIFEVKISLCLAHWSILGLSINHTLSAARAITEERRGRG